MFMTKRQLAILAGFLAIAFLFRQALELTLLWTLFIAILLIQVFRLKNENAFYKSYYDTAQQHIVGQQPVPTPSPAAPPTPAMPTATAQPRPPLLAKILMRHFKK